MNVGIYKFITEDKKFETGTYFYWKAANLSL